ncbi:MAG: dCTP deaminase [Candidatus Zixiibacteriota bacterium]
MSVMSDQWIIRMSREKRMIEPFSPEQVRKGISYGVSSYGYDISLADEFRLLNPDETDLIDPKTITDQQFKTIKTNSLVLPANTFALCRSREYFRIPRDILTVCFGKSTYARCGVVVNITPFEPEWEGFATISLSNTAPRPVRVYASEGIAQLLFIRADEICAQSYKDKKGKYQAQQEITLSKPD